MSNSKFNNNKKVTPVGHEFQLSPGQYSDVLVNDFFSFVEGKYDDMKVIRVDKQKSNIGDIKQMSKVLHAGDTAWKEYCNWYGLPSECRKLYINKIKKQWEKAGNKEKTLQLSN